MSSEPRIQLNIDGSAVSEIFNVDSNDNVAVVSLDSGNVKIDSLIDGENIQYSSIDRRKRSFLAQIETNNGWDISGNTWNTAPYNVVRYNKIAGATFDTASYTLTVEPGTYFFDCFHKTHGAGDTNVRLYNPTTSTEIKQGSMAYGGSSAPMTIKTEIEFTETTDIVMQVKPRDNTSWGAGVVRDDYISTNQTPYAGEFYVERVE